MQQKMIVIFDNCDENANANEMWLAVEGVQSIEMSPSMFGYIPCGFFVVGITNRSFSARRFYIAGTYLG